MQRTASRVTLAFAILTASAAVGAQSPAAPPAPPHKLIAFDVASIRLQKEHSGGPIRFTEDGFSADAGPLEYLIRNAYNITRDHSIRGLPAWGAADYYVVSAKVADSDLRRVEDLHHRPAQAGATAAPRRPLPPHPPSGDGPDTDLLTHRRQRRPEDAASHTPSTW